MLENIATMAGPPPETAQPPAGWVLPLACVAGSSSGRPVWLSSASPAGVFDLGRAIAGERFFVAVRPASPLELPDVSD
jgi:hypothetical protein